MLPLSDGRPDLEEAAGARVNEVGAGAEVEALGLVEAGEEVEHSALGMGSTGPL